MNDFIKDTSTLLTGVSAWVIGVVQDVNWVAVVGLIVMIVSVASKEVNRWLRPTHKN